MPYGYDYEPVARRQLRRLSATDRRRVRARIKELADNPRGHQAKQLRGRQVRWTSRVGSLRVIYRIDDTARMISVEAIGNRDNIYELMRRRG